MFDGYRWGIANFSVAAKNLIPTKLSVAARNTSGKITGRKRKPKLRWALAAKQWRFMLYSVHDICCLITFFCLSYIACWNVSFIRSCSLCFAMVIVYQIWKIHRNSPEHWVCSHKTDCEQNRNNNVKQLSCYIPRFQFYICYRTRILESLIEETYSVNKRKHKSIEAKAGLIVASG